MIKKTSATGTIPAQNFRLDGDITRVHGYHETLGLALKGSSAYFLNNKSFDPLANFTNNVKNHTGRSTTGSMKKLKPLGFPRSPFYFVHIHLPGPRSDLESCL